jgi:hypothetical protein
MVIDIGIGREYHSSIPTIVIGRQLKPLNVRTDLLTKLDGPVGRILVVKKKSVYPFTFH